MFKGRLFVFSCDICDADFPTPNYGGPDGMKYFLDFKDSNKIKHICNKCLSEKRKEGKVVTHEEDEKRISLK